MRSTADKRAFAKHHERLATTPSLHRVIVAQGGMIAEGPAAVLKSAASAL